MDQSKPLAGIVMGNNTEEMNETQTDHGLYLVYKKKGGVIGRRLVEFHDNTGILFSGLWYATIQVKEYDNSDIDVSLEEMKTHALHSAVAIPLWYIIGKGKENSEKYCVITNWWKERSRNGVYSAPRLDFSLHRRGTDMTEAAEEDPDVDYNHVI